MRRWCCEVLADGTGEADANVGLIDLGRISDQLEVDVGIGVLPQLDGLVEDGLPLGNGDGLEGGLDEFGFVVFFGDSDCPRRVSGVGIDLWEVLGPIGLHRGDGVVWRSVQEGNRDGTAGFDSTLGVKASDGIGDLVFTECVWLSRTRIDCCQVLFHAQFPLLHWRKKMI